LLAANKLKPIEILMSPKSIALTIAGFDPSSGAGITADLKTFAAHRMYGIACISALTVQSTLGVRAVQPVEPALVRQTLECLAEDAAWSGIKIGMLGSGEVAAEVADFLSTAGIDRQRVVLDPVLRSSSGKDLLDANGISILRNELLQWVGWITPNVQELAILTGQSVEAGAARLAKLGLNVVVTGGDQDPPSDFLRTAVGEEKWFRGERVETNQTHGTGCAFSSALLCGLIQRKGPMEAVESAKHYVTQALRAAYPTGKGKGSMNHLFEFDSECFR
jgi:hydroxymethylpyrimidine/phosphomethylpyrimidine kinase